MKTNLTPEQSQRLIELGVAPSKASMCELYFPESGSDEPLESWQMWEENGKLLCNPDESRVQDVERVVVPKSADYDLSIKEEHPIFTFTDILSLLPKEIYSEGLDITFCLSVEMRTFSSSVRYNNPNYRKSFGPTISASELIDALYKLLVWAIQQKFIKQ